MARHRSYHREAASSSPERDDRYGAEQPALPLRYVTVMGRTWFTSDTHFGHANIIGYSKRPFATVAEMDGALVTNWNAVVRPDDDVWHLGDFCFRSTRSPESYLRRLTGRVHLVWGNHDGQETKRLAGLASSQPYAEVTVDGTRLVLFHYAMRVWNRSHQGSIHLYGHSHASLPGDRQSLDVGVDCFDYRPVGLDDIVRRLRTQPERVPVDHHGRGD